MSSTLCKSSMFEKKKKKSPDQDLFQIFLSSGSMKKIKKGFSALQHGCPTSFQEMHHTEISSNTPCSIRAGTKIYRLLHH